MVRALRRSGSEQPSESLRIAIDQMEGDGIRPDDLVAQCDLERLRPSRIGAEGACPGAISVGQRGRERA